MVKNLSKMVKTGQNFLKMTKNDQKSSKIDLKLVNMVMWFKKNFWKLTVQFLWWPFQFQIDENHSIVENFQVQHMDYLVLHHRHYPFSYRQRVRFSLALSLGADCSSLMPCGHLPPNQVSQLIHHWCQDVHSTGIETADC